MRQRCEARVRTYFYKSRDQVRGAAAALLPALDQLMAEMLTQLKQDRFHGHYFDRSSDGQPLCDERGEFECQGAFSEERCGYSEHLVNPYRSREERIMFSTWNLDHRWEPEGTGQEGRGVGSIGRRSSGVKIRVCCCVVIGEAMVYYVSLGRRGRCVGFVPSADGKPVILS